MTQGKPITVEEVQAIKAMKRDCPYLTNTQIGLMLDPRRSETTVRKALAGGYDHLMDAPEAGSDGLVDELRMEHRQLVAILNDLQATLDCVRFAVEEVRDALAKETAQDGLCDRGA